MGQESNNASAVTAVPHRKSDKNSRISRRCAGWPHRGDDATGRTVKALRSIEIVVSSVDEIGVVDLLALAVGGNPPQLHETVQQYRKNPAIKLLAARDDNVLVGMAGYTVEDNEITLLHIATAASARQRGIGRRLLAAVRRATLTTLPLVAETDTDSVGFYIATGFTVIPLGDKYPGVERFHARLG